MARSPSRQTPPEDAKRSASLLWTSSSRPQATDSRFRSEEALQAGVVLSLPSAYMPTYPASFMIIKFTAWRWVSARPRFFLQIRRVVGYLVLPASPRRGTCSVDPLLLSFFLKERLSDGIPVNPLAALEGVRAVG